MKMTEQRLYIPAVPVFPRQSFDQSYTWCHMICSI